MQKSPKPIVTELCWLAVCLGLTLLLSLLLWGKDIFKSTVDIHLHDTYFVIAPLHMLLPFFLLVSFLFYFTREFRHSFRRSLPNWILLITGLALVITLTFLVKIFSAFTTMGWTAYPPLSALEQQTIPQVTQEPIVSVLVNVFTVIQAVVVLQLLFVTFRWGNHDRS